MSAEQRARLRWLAAGTSVANLLRDENAPLNDIDAAIARWDAARTAYRRARREELYRRSAITAARDYYRGTSQ